MIKKLTLTMIKKKMILITKMNLEMKKMQIPGVNMKVQMSLRRIRIVNQGGQSGLENLMRG